MQREETVSGDIGVKERVAGEIRSRQPARVSPCTLFAPPFFRNILAVGREQEAGRADTDGVMSYGAAAAIKSHQNRGNISENSSPW